MSLDDRRLPPLMMFITGVLGLAIMARLFMFTADDAYGYMRAGENWIHTGKLSFNPSERINHLTAPLLAMGYGLVYALTGQTRMFYKLVGLACWLLCIALVYRRAPRGSLHAVCAASLVLLPHSVIMWSIGGMETPENMAFCTASAYLASNAKQVSLRSLIAIHVMAGLAFIARMDSALFMTPVCLYAMRGQSLKRIAVAMGVGGFLPLLWCIVSTWYFVELLPTSAYVKSPDFTAAALRKNAIYLTENLTFTGAIPLAVLLALTRRSPRNGLRHAKLRWGIYLGLALQFLFGLTTATTHMMFGFRFFVPYLPALALLLAECGLPGDEKARPPLPAAAALGFLMSVLIFGGAAGWWAWNRSVQGFATVGEARRVSIHETVEAMKVFKQIAEDVRADWERNPPPGREHPRIFVWAEGLIPYTYREAYFYGILVSYRHNCKPDLRRMADYIIYPGAQPEGMMRIVSARPFRWGQRDDVVVALRNLDPQPDILPSTIDGPCDIPEGR